MLSATEALKSQVVAHSCSLWARATESQSGVQQPEWLSPPDRSCLATLVERKSRFVMLVKIPGRHTSEEAVAALAGRIQALPTELFRSLTWDQGKEMPLHKQFTIDTGIQIYFCDPKSPWQRGSNENTNGLLRQYFPKAEASPGSHKKTSTRSPRNSTDALDRPSAS